jgi:hypothetical protein
MISDNLNFTSEAGASSYSIAQSINRIFVVDKIKEKYNKRLLSFFEKEASARITEEEIKKKYNRDHLIEARLQGNEDTKKKNEEKFNKHRAKLKSLINERKTQENFNLERLNRSSISPRRLNTSEKPKRTIIKANNSTEDKYIDAKLHEFNMKLLKSNENYNKNLQEKIELIQNTRRTVHSIDDNEEYNFRIKSISDKYENACSRRKKLKKEFNEKIQKRENKLLEKSQKIKKIFSEEIEKIEKQNKSIEEKDEKVSELIIKIKRNTKNKVETKQEKNKALEAGINQNIINIKKINDLKKEKILGKHLEIERKKQEHYEYLESLNKEIREKTMSFTIEKEKASTLKALALKLQSPEDLKKLLERYQAKK